MIIIAFIMSDYHLLAGSTSEGFAGPNLNNCNIYQKDKINFTGTAYYPLNDNNRLLEVNETEIAYPHSQDIPHYEGEVDFQNTMHPKPTTEGRNMQGLTTDRDLWVLKANA